MPPAPGHAVGLQLDRLRAVRAAEAEEPELVLDVVGVLMGDDVRDAEVARGVAVAGALTRQPAQHAGVEVGGEALCDVDRVVGRAGERRTPTRRGALAGST